MIRRRLYVGVKPTGERELFRCAFVPTEATHGDRFQYVIGPFRSVGGALYMQRNKNASLTVSEAEHLARAA